MDLPLRERQSGAWARVADAFGWWKRELQWLVPQSLVDALASYPRLLSLQVQPEGFGASVTYHTLSGDVRTAIDEGVFENFRAVETLTRIRKTHGSLIVARIVVPQSQCLVLERTIPDVALPHIDEIMALELERKTPFDKAAIFAAPIIARPEPGRADRHVRHVVVKRSQLTPLIEALRESHIPLADVGLATQTGQIESVALLTHIDTGPKPVDRVLLRLVAWLAVALLGVLIIWSAMSFWRQHEALQQLEAEVAGAKKTAVALRQERSRRDDLVARIAALHRRKAQDPSMIGIWEEITRLLPDTSWLSELRREEGALVLDGHSRAAADLIGLLSRWALAARVEFLSPVIRDPQNGMERFKIKVQLRDTKAAKASVQRSAVEVTE